MIADDNDLKLLDEREDLISFIEYNKRTEEAIRAAFRVDIIEGQLAVSHYLI